MSFKLKRAILVFFLLLIIFIALMIYSEYKNIELLKKEYNMDLKAIQLKKAKLNVWALKLILNFGIPLLFLTSKLSQKIDNFASKDRGFIGRGMVYGLIFFFIMFLINLPLNFYSSYYLNHKYGISNQSIFRWIELNIKSFLTGDLLIALSLWLPYYIINKGPKTWWLSLSMLSIPLVIFMVFISPVIIDPIFNKYTSIKDEKLGLEIASLLEKADIKDANIYKVDKSKDTKTMNAYMTGISKSKRIVLWDTTIDNLNQDEVLSITAHEIGHYIRGHIWKSIILSIVGIFLLIFSTYVSSNWIMKYSLGSFGFKNISTYASLPLLLMVLNIYLFLGNPISNSISRSMEVEADGIEISLTGDRESAVSAMNKLSTANLGIRRRSKFYEVWYQTHPSLEDRIEFYKKHPID